jgi:hypothetical protein
MSGWKNIFKYYLEMVGAQSHSHARKTIQNFAGQLARN